MALIVFTFNWRKVALIQDLMNAVILESRVEVER